MAAAFEATASATYDITLPADGSTVTTSHDFGSASNRFAEVHLTWRTSNGHSITGVTINGVAMTQFGAQVTQTQCGAHKFYLVAPASGSVDIVVDPSTGLGATNCVMTVAVYSGVDQSTPFTDYTTATGTDTTAELTIPADTGELATFFIAGRANTPSGWAATGCTERLDNVMGESLGGCGDEPGDGSVAMVGTISAVSVTSWVAMGEALIAAAAGGATGPGNYYQYYTRTVATV